MKASVVQDNLSKFSSALNGPERLSVSEMARSSKWRKRLASVGCYEVVDRSESIAFVLDPSCAEAIEYYIMELETALEESQLREMLLRREKDRNPEMGLPLLNSVENRLEERSDRLSELLAEKRATA